MVGRTVAARAACVVLMLGCGTSVAPPHGAPGVAVAPAPRAAPEVVAFDRPPAVRFVPGSDPLEQTVDPAFMGSAGILYTCPEGAAQATPARRVDPVVVAL